jgi:hypothetical protein
MGIDTIHGRQLFLTTLTDSWEWSEAMIGRFVLFTGGDATTASDPQIASYAQAGVDVGCAYVCCWGPDCQRVHDAFDLAAIDHMVYSTWHSDERLAEAMYFAAFLTHLDPEEVDGADVAVLFAVQQQWHEAARALLTDQDELVRQFTEDE